MSTAPIYGLLAEFDAPEELVAAAERAYADGYRRLDAYTPFPVHGLAEAIGFRTQPASAPGPDRGHRRGGAGFFSQYYAAVIDYPINVGGRPLNSWPAFIPITFEVTILVAAVTAVLGMLALNGLPQPYHPVFNAPRFALATRDRFFLCIEAADPRFDSEATRKFLEGLGAKEVTDVEP